MEFRHVELVEVDGEVVQIFGLELPQPMLVLHVLIVDQQLLLEVHENELCSIFWKHELVATPIAPIFLFRGFNDNRLLLRRHSFLLLFTLSCRGRC
jgi:hypothetical protein